MARTPKKDLTRYDKLTYKEFRQLPESEQDEIWDEHIEELKRRGDYNENAEEDFPAFLKKICKTNK
jgi:hypothetical protein